MPAADTIAMMKCKIFNRSIATSLHLKVKGAVCSFVLNALT